MLITEDQMTSDATHHHAQFLKHRAADGEGGWVVSWLPTRILSQSQAVTAMTIAETVEAHTHEIAALGVMAITVYESPWMHHIEGWAGELHMDTADVLDAVQLNHPDDKVMIAPPLPHFVRAYHIFFAADGSESPNPRQASKTLTMGVSRAGDIYLTGSAIGCHVLKLRGDVAASVATQLTNMCSVSDGIMRAPIV